MKPRLASITIEPTPIPATAPDGRDLELAAGEVVSLFDGVVGVVPPMAPVPAESGSDDGSGVPDGLIPVRSVVDGCGDVSVEPVAAAAMVDVVEVVVSPPPKCGGVPSFCGLASVQVGLLHGSPLQQPSKPLPRHL